jgi:hypothetical protein
LQRARKSGDILDEAAAPSRAIGVGSPGLPMLASSGRLAVEKGSPAKAHINGEAV